MPIDTFIAYVGVYADVADADADYDLVKDLHRGRPDRRLHAAVIQRREDGKVKITRSTRPRPGSVASSAAGSGWPPLVVALFPFAGIGAGCWPPPPAAGPAGPWPDTPPPA